MAGPSSRSAEHVSQSSTAWSTGYNYLLRLSLGALGEDACATYFSQSLDNGKYKNTKRRETVVVQVGN